MSKKLTPKQFRQIVETVLDRVAIRRFAKTGRISDFDHYRVVAMANYLGFDVSANDPPNSVNIGGYSRPLLRLEQQRLFVAHRTPTYSKHFEADLKKTAEVLGIDYLPPGSDLGEGVDLDDLAARLGMSVDELKAEMSQPLKPPLMKLRAYSERHRRNNL